MVGGKIVQVMPWSGETFLVLDDQGNVWEVSSACRGIVDGWTLLLQSPLQVTEEEAIAALRPLK